MRQTRYDSRDLMLAADNGAFSRFMPPTRRAAVCENDPIRRLF